MNNDDVAYIPNIYIENLSCEALGLMVYLIAWKEQEVMTFSQIKKANRTRLNKFNEVMEELIAKGSAELLKEDIWKITFEQPEGSCHVLVVNDLK